MTQDEIIRMATEAGFGEYFWLSPTYESYDNELKTLERFAALVEQRVRSEIALEELAKINQELGGY